MAFTERKQACDPYGTHRVLDQKKCLPQAAQKVDNSLPIFPNELLITVEKLNIDAASFVQMEKQTGGDDKKIAQIVMDNCRAIGKQQNGVTGSGGILIGKLAQKGSAYQGPIEFDLGTSLATLVSLTLTPLHLDEVLAVDKARHQLTVKGHAILFQSGIAAALPADLPATVALAVFDVSGAPALVKTLTQSGQTIVILGAGGKAGLLSCAAGRNAVGPKGKVIAVEPYGPAAKALREMSLCDEVLEIDAQDALAVSSGVASVTHGKMGDVVINVVSAPDTEMASILCAHANAKVVFFGMATQFSKAALGAEGVASSAQLFIGNGYTPGHAELCLTLLKQYPKLREVFFQRFA